LRPYLDPQNLYHHGIVVCDLDAAIGVFSRESGLAFQDPLAVTQTVVTDSGTRKVEFQLAYSIEGPVHTELVLQMPGTVWETDQAAKIHHLGYWSDDLAADGRRLEEAGMRLVVSHEPDPGSMSIFRYYQSTLGPYIELVDSCMRSTMEAAWADASAKSTRGAE